MDIENNEEYAYSALKKFFDNNTENITMSATVNRALIDKNSTEMINQKVNNQSNSIQASIFQINPKFNEKSKYYDSVKKDISEVLRDYEKALTKCCDRYDIKLEKLLIKKVELESHLVGKIFKEEKFKNEESFSEKEKKNDKLKTNLAEKSKKRFEFIFKNKKKNDVDIQDIRKLEDAFDLEQEQNKMLNKKIEKIQEENKTNMSEIAKIEIDIKNLNEEVERICNEKKIFIEEAMETKAKEISKIVKKPSAFSRITRFFSYRFNTYKAIKSSTIEPLKLRISEFETLNDTE